MGKGGYYSALLCAHAIFRGKPQPQCSHAAECHERDHTLSCRLKIYYIKARGQRNPRRRQNQSRSLSILSAETADRVCFSRSICRGAISATFALRQGRPLSALDFSSQRADPAGRGAVSLERDRDEGDGRWRRPAGSAQPRDLHLGCWINYRASQPTRFFFFHQLFKMMSQSFFKISGHFCRIR